MKAIQWAPDGNPLNGRPGLVQAFLASPTTVFGYAYGEGWSIIFGSEQGDLQVEATQWIVKQDDGKITVEDSYPSPTFEGTTQQKTSTMTPSARPRTSRPESGSSSQEWQAIEQDSAGQIDSPSDGTPAAAHQNPHDRKPQS